MTYNLPLQQGQMPKSIDMSKIDWNVFADFQQVLVYLRNMELCNNDIFFQFETMQYEDKCKFIYTYLTSDIHVCINELDCTIANITLRHLGIKCKEYTFMSDAEFLNYNKQHAMFLDTIANIAYSSIYSISAMLSDGRFKFLPKTAKLDCEIHENILNAIAKMIPYEFDLIKTDLSIIDYKSLFPYQRNHALYDLAAKSKLILMLSNFGTDSFNMLCKLLAQL